MLMFQAYLRVRNQDIPRQEVVDAALPLSVARTDISISRCVPRLTAILLQGLVLSTAGVQAHAPVYERFMRYRIY